MTKRDWLKKLKALKTAPRKLSPAECDELILLLGGSVRPNHRPAVTVFGYNRRVANWTAIAEVVFSFIENAERLKQLEAEQRHATDQHDLSYLKNTIETLKPIAAKNRAEAIRFAVEWFRLRGVTRSFKQIEGEILALQKAAKKAAGLERLQLAEWRTIKANNK